MILGDNIFYGHGHSEQLRLAADQHFGATVFAYHVDDLEEYGIVQFNADKKAIDIEEKPSQPKLNYAVTDLYFYDSQVTDFAKALEPSERGELEITDMNRTYLEQGSLQVKLMGRGVARLDTGTHESIANGLKQNEYGKYLLKMLNEEIY